MAMDTGAAELKEQSLKEKSAILDEVNQLLDLMVTEKQTLQKRINDLEAEVKQSTAAPTATGTCDVERDKGHKGAIANLEDFQKAVARERAAISELNQRVDRIWTCCTRERREYQQKIEQANSKLNHLQVMLRKQKNEIKKLQDEVLTSRQNCERFETGYKSAAANLEKMCEKYSRARTSLLAGKRRTVLELRKQNEQQKERQEKEIETVTETEKKVNEELKATLAEKENEIRHLRKDLKEKDEEILKTNNRLKLVKKDVSSHLHELEKELQSSRKELSELRELLEIQKEQLKRSDECLKQEQTQSQILLTKSQTAVTRVLCQIDNERLEHQKEVHTLNVAMATQRQEWALQLDRLKDVSMKRCTELAKEVWLLKSKNQ